MTTTRIPLTDPRVTQLACARQQLAHNSLFLPTWGELTDTEREDSLPDARSYLQAAVLADLIHSHDLAAENARLRAELTRRRTDDLTIRGALAPADGPRHVPMPLGDSVTPAVEWLIADRDHLHAELATTQAQLADAGPAVCADCGHLESAHPANEDGDCNASGARVRGCTCTYFIPPWAARPGA